MIDHNSIVHFSKPDTVAVSLPISIDDADFVATFVDKKWSLNWKLKDGCHPPKLSNTAAQYRINPSAVDEYDVEVSDWIKRGWLVEFDGEHKGVIPLMAVVQLNKAKVRPVMDYRDVNQYVFRHTAESEICGQKLREWRKLGDILAIIDLKKAYLQIHVCLLYTSPSPRD